MRTLAPAGVVLAIAVAGAMLGASGFADAWGAEPPKTQAAQDHLEKAGERLKPGGSDRDGDGEKEAVVSGPVSSADSSIVGLISSGLDGIAMVAVSVALLPVTLINLGFPAWFAGPLGVIGQVVMGIGIIEFATNRELT